MLQFQGVHVFELGHICNFVKSRHGQVCTCLNLAHVQFFEEPSSIVYLTTNYYDNTDFPILYCWITRGDRQLSKISCCIGNCVRPLQDSTRFIVLRMLNLRLPTINIRSFICVGNLIQGGLKNLGYQAYLADHTAYMVTLVTKRVMRLPPSPSLAILSLVRLIYLS